MEQSYSYHTEMCYFIVVFYSSYTTAIWQWQWLKEQHVIFLSIYTLADSGGGVVEIAATVKLTPPLVTS